MYEAIWGCLEDSSPEHASHVNNCSRQIGKSFVTLVICVEVCLGAKKTVLFAAPYKDQAEEIITGKTYYAIFETCPESLKPKLDGAKAIDFANGSRIRIGGVDNRNYNYMRGGAADLLVLDEAGFMAHLDDGVLPALQPMLLTTKGKTIFNSTPPPNLDHPYVAIVHSHAERGHLSTFTVFDNTSLSEDDLIKEYMNTSCTRNPDGTWKLSTRFRREFMAELIMENTILIARDWNDEFIIDLPVNEYHGYHHRYVMMDPGVTDFNATLFGYYDHIARHFHIEDELTMNGPTLDTSFLAAEVKRVMKERWGEKLAYRYIADNNNLHLIQDLKRLHDLPFIGTTKTVLETRAASQQEGMVNKLNTWLREGRVSVHPRCKLLIGCLRHGIWKEDGENRRSFSHSAIYGHYDHLAALIYGVRNVDVNTNPIPGNYGYNPQTMFKPKATLADHGKQLNTLHGALVPRRR